MQIQVIYRRYNCYNQPITIKTLKLMYTHPFFRRFFSFLLFYLSSYSICIAASTEAIISTKYLLIEHANYNIYGDRLNKEQGRIPGLQLAVSSTSKRLEGIASVDIYSGNVPYDGKATNGDFSSTTSIKLNRFSYRLMKSDLIVTPNFTALLPLVTGIEIFNHKAI